MEIVWVIASVMLLPLLVDALSVLGRLRLPADAAGRAGRGVMIFVESIRWLSVRWGLRSVAAGFRRAGFDGECLYWRWHETWRGWLVLPAIMDRALLERQAERLAEFIARRRREHPAAPIHLVGYSCGGYVAVRALELLPPEVKVDAAGLLAPAMDPRRNLCEARSHLTGPLVVVSSLLDWLIGGLGTLAFGTGDRRHRPSAGMIGRRGPAGEVVEIRWRPSLVRLGYLGGHFSVTAPGFIQQCVATAMRRGRPGGPCPAAKSGCSG